jgi:hypothetical protein
MVEIIISQRKDWEELRIMNSTIEEGKKLGEGDHKWLLEHADAHGFNADDVEVRHATLAEEINLAKHGSF